MVYIALQGLTLLRVSFHIIIKYLDTLCTLMLKMLQVPGYPISLIMSQVHNYSPKLSGNLLLLVEHNMRVTFGVLSIPEGFLKEFLSSPQLTTTALRPLSVLLV